MSAASTRQQPAQPTDTIVVNGVTYRATATHLYRVHESHSVSPGALVDGGANGGLAGNDMRVIETSLLHTADVVGVTNDVMHALPLCQAVAKLPTASDGYIIGIFSNYAQRADTGPTIHSKGQLESFGMIVDDKSRSVGGSQCIVTLEGYVVPLNIRDGLPYVDMEPPTDEEMDLLPHVYFCSDSPWDPAVLDCKFTAEDFDPPDIALE